MFDNLNGARLATKRVQTAYALKSSTAREAVARVGGWRDWHHLEATVGTPNAPMHRHDDDLKRFLADKAPSVDVDALIATAIPDDRAFPAGEGAALTLLRGGRRPEWVEIGRDTGTWQPEDEAVTGSGYLNLRPLYAEATQYELVENEEIVACLSCVTYEHDGHLDGPMSSVRAVEIAATLPIGHPDHLAIALQDASHLNGDISIVWDVETLAGRDADADIARLIPGLTANLETFAPDDLVVMDEIGAAGRSWVEKPSILTAVQEANPGMRVWVASARTGERRAVDMSAVYAESARQQIRIAAQRIARDRDVLIYGRPAMLDALAQAMPDRVAGYAVAPIRTMTDLARADRCALEVFVGIDASTVRAAFRDFWPARRKRIILLDGCEEGHMKDDDLWDRINRRAQREGFVFDAEHMPRIGIDREAHEINRSDIECQFDVMHAGGEIGMGLV